MRKEARLRTFGLVQRNGGTLGRMSLFDGLYVWHKRALWSGRTKGWATHLKALEAIGHEAQYCEPAARDGLFSSSRENSGQLSAGSVPLDTNTPHVCQFAPHHLSNYPSVTHFLCTTSADLGHEGASWVRTVAYLSQRIDRRKLSARGSSIHVK